jgi:hypothetical protein
MNSVRSILMIAAVLTTGLTVFQVFLHFSRKKAEKSSPGRFATFAALTVLNFTVFWWVSVLSGGDALNGKIVGDQYFLANHGRYTQVSVSFWLYSLTHTWVTILSFAALLGWLIVGAIFGRIELPGNDDELHPRGRGTV